jgi:hypothetical protein
MMPAIIGAFNKLKPAQKPKTPPSGATTSRGPTSGVVTWVIISGIGALSVPKRPPPPRPKQNPGASSNGNGQVPVGGYTGYRNVVNALRTTQPATFSDQDWTLCFQANTSFDNSISTLLGDSVVTVASDGELDDANGVPLTTLVWFTITWPVVRLLSVSTTTLLAGFVSPSATMLWAAPTVSAVTTSHAP